MKYALEMSEKLKNCISPTGVYLIPVTWQDYGTIRVKAANLYDALTKPLADTRLEDITEYDEWSPESNNLHVTEGNEDFYNELQNATVEEAFEIIHDAVFEVYKIRKLVNFYVWLRSLDDYQIEPEYICNADATNLTSLADAIWKTRRRLECVVQSWVLALADKIKTRYPEFNIDLDLTQEIYRYFQERTCVHVTYCSEQLKNIITILEHLTDCQDAQTFTLTGFPEIRFSMNATLVAGTLGAFAIEVTNEEN